MINTTKRVILKLVRELGGLRVESSSNNGRRGKKRNGNRAIRITSQDASCSEEKSRELWKFHGFPFPFFFIILQNQTLKTVCRLWRKGRPAMRVFLSLPLPPPLPPPHFSIFVILFCLFSFHFLRLSFSCFCFFHLLILSCFSFLFFLLFLLSFWFVSFSVSPFFSLSRFSTLLFFSPFISFSFPFSLLLFFLLSSFPHSFLPCLGGGGR